MLFRPNVLVPRFLGSSALSTILMCHTPAVSLLSGHRGAASMTSLANLDVGKLQIKQSTAKKTIPTFDANLPFGKHFSDHMFEVEWNNAEGFAPPRIVPFHKLELDPASPCLHYGVQCFEGMKAYKDSDGKIRLFRPDMNMKRWFASCTRLALPTFDQEQMIGCIKELLKVDANWVPEQDGFSYYLRPTAIATSSTLGVVPPSEALFFVIGCPVGPYFKDGFAPVKILAESKFKRAWPGGTGNAKVGGNYAPGLLPQRLAQEKGYSQVLWLFGEEDYITEVGAMNIMVFWENAQGKKELVTAPLDGTILPGVTRDSILELTRAWGEFDVTERAFTMGEVVKAAEDGRLIEVFGAGTAAIVAPINGIAYQGKELAVPCGKDGKAGDLAARLYHDLCDIQYGRKQFSNWSVRVE